MDYKQKLLPKQSSNLTLFVRHQFSVKGYDSSPSSVEERESAPAQGSTVSPQMWNLFVSEDILLFLGEGCLYISPNNWYSTLNTIVHTYSHMFTLYSPLQSRNKKVFLFNGLEQKIMCIDSKSVNRIEWQGVKERTVYLWKLETWFLIQASFFAKPWSLLYLKRHSSFRREVS